jgi:hypothetical protein
MSPNVPEFEWTATRAEAAYLLAEDQLTDDQIAERLRLNRRTLTRWKDCPGFQARVAEHRDAIEQAITSRGIARRARRVEALDRRWEKMRSVIDARAADPDMAAVPGGPTGLLVRSYKQVGEDRVEEYEVDAGLLRELREHEKQAAQELGQWAVKITGSGENGEVLVKVLGPKTSMSDL